MDETLKAQVKIALAEREAALVRTTQLHRDLLALFENFRRLGQMAFADVDTPALATDLVEAAQVVQESTHEALAPMTVLVEDTLRTANAPQRRHHTAAGGDAAMLNQPRTA